MAGDFGLFKGFSRSYTKELRATIHDEKAAGDLFFYRRVKSDDIEGCFKMSTTCTPFLYYVSLHIHMRQLKTHKTNLQKVLIHDRYDALIHEAEYWTSFDAFPARNVSRTGCPATLSGSGQFRYSPNKCTVFGSFKENFINRLHISTDRDSYPSHLGLGIHVVSVPSSPAPPSILNCKPSLKKQVRAPLTPVSHRCPTHP
ncbi:uncharacterized protein BDR25DRAFT_354312 [Lindgomyces ingoldianus]|uniref:Uncharacterized protein n=1 Tax=Lindgomyces ingoldianus TaxID=673940 RepID=A0ACB6R0F9_9PLEO|nr:uncharacterized protein BDR25DRAFT_354312 [Lindgomyces ingoldianus]KAF2471817.1 hypothetical protein BDR25DRAFT_354312 [Lindgomyces ingoldianus]